jgi:hypothetical protein
MYRDEAERAVRLQAINFWASIVRYVRMDSRAVYFFGMNMDELQDAGDTKQQNSIR